MEEPIRVLEVFHGMDCGGAENMIMNIYREIDHSKVQMDFLVHTDKSCFFDEEIKQLGGRIYSVPYYNIKNQAYYKKTLNKFFKEHPEIKVVHGHLGSCAHIYLKVAKKYGCFTIAHSHNTKPEVSLKSILYRIFTYQTRKVADYFIGCGKEAGEYRFGKKITSNPNRYHTLNNAIDTNKFLYDTDRRKSVRQEFGIGDDELLLGHVGRFNYQKNHEYLIDIFEAVITKNSNVKLLLVGDGDLRKQIEKKVNTKGLSKKVIFAGLRNDVPRLLQGMDCFVFPSHYEGVPVTIVEAQAAGLPCVISDSITKEVCVSELVKYVSLNAGVEEWEKMIALSCNKTRINRKEDIVCAGYDIEKTVGWITDLYLKVPMKG